jgi:hypothetical protein
MADTIRDFLVSLGYEVDGAGQKKFDKALKDSTKAAKELTVGIAGGITEMEALGKQFADVFDSLYFTARRTGASVADIGSVSAAFQNLGSSSDSAKAAMEGLASFQRKYPGGGGYLEQVFGVKPQDLGNQAKVVEDIAEAFQKMSTSQAIAYGGVLGFDEKTVLAMRDPEFIPNLERANNLFKEMGVNQDEAAKKGHELETQFTGLGIAVQAIGANFFNAFEPALKWFNDWALPLLEKGVKVMNGFGRMFTNAFEFLGEQSVYHKEGAFNSKSPLHQRAMASLQDKLAAGPLAGGKDYTNSSSAPGTPAGPMTANRMMSYFMQQGWTKAQAAGIVANLMAESNGNPGAVGDSGLAYGLAQWHPDRQAEFKKRMGKDIRQSTEEEQLQFVQYEMNSGKFARVGSLLRNTTTAGDASNIVTGNYEIPRDIVGQSYLRSNAAEKLNGATLNQTTTINVNGASNANDVANRVSSAQSKTNADLVRNFEGVYQ